jgi:surfactin synthase thioesterase subunit
LSQNSITNKDIALFCCHAGGGEGKAFKHYKEKLKGNRFIGEIELKDPLKAKDESVNKLKKWLQNI